MAAIGDARAKELISKATEAGMTDDQIAKIVNDLGRGGMKYMGNLSEKDARSFRNSVDAYAAQAKRRAGLATDRQVSYIMDLLAKHPGGGMHGNMPTDLNGVKALKFEQASFYIDSLMGDY